MSTTNRHVDRTLLAIVFILVVAGFFIFSSASLGLLARNTGAQISTVAFGQILFGLVGGSIAMFLTSQLHYRNLRKYAFYIFVASALITLLVFTPLGFSHGGATRWISIGSFTMQPSELLKVGFIIYMATWLSGVHKQIGSFKHGTLPFLGLTAIAGVIFLIQPDTDSFMLTAMAAVTMFFTAGGSWRDIAIMFLTGVVLLVILAFMRPYLMDRFTTFLHPESDPQGSGYQIQQSLIAVGSGGFFGRGYGQSIQKFQYLPEPIGDSIFSVFAEEFGFVGTTLLVALYVAFTFRGYKIAAHASDLFGMLLVVGFMTMIFLQSFLNIAAMLSIAPLQGLTLPFISHGGTSLLVTLAVVGVVLNVSRYQRKSV